MRPSNFQLRSLLVVVAVTMSVSAKAGPDDHSVLEAQQGSIPVFQLKVALNTREALFERPDFIAKVASFHGMNTIRFAGNETGRQRQLIETFLAAVCQRAWIVSSTGTMTDDDWVSREAAVIYHLEATPTFLAWITSSEGVTIQQFAALSPSVIAARVRAHASPCAPTSSRYRSADGTRN